MASDASKIPYKPVSVFPVSGPSPLRLSRPARSGSAWHVFARYRCIFGTACHDLAAVRSMLGTYAHR